MKQPKRVGYYRKILLCLVPVLVIGASPVAYHVPVTASPISGTPVGWGAGTSGQLGISTLNGSTTPVPVSEINDVTAISAGSSYTLVLKVDGTVWGWGSNLYGQLGGVNSSGVINPVQVSGLSNIIAVRNGDSHALTLKNDGTVWAWGSDSSGQLGNGTMAAGKNPPTQVNGLSNITSIAAGGYHSLALRESDGTVWAWGSNSFGQLGNNTTTGSGTPVQVNGLTGITAISASGNVSLALRADGTVWAWGYNNYGQLGNGTNTNSKIPVQVTGLANAVAISTGGYHGLALKSNGTVSAWGKNIYGQLGNGNKTSRNTIADVNNLNNVATITAGGDHSMALKLDGTVWTWGGNTYGQLGNGTYTESINPLQVTGLSNVTAISAGKYHSFGLIPSGQTPPARLPSTTALTSSVNPSAPGKSVTFTATVSATPPAAGTPTGSVTFKDGTITLASVALNAGGQASYNTPNLSSGSHTITAYYSGDSNFGASIRVSTQVAGAPVAGNVWAWGNNPHGELGDGTITNKDLPVNINSLSSIISLSGGGSHTIALKSDGTVSAWGDNVSGQLGNGTFTTSNSPVQVSGLDNIIAINASLSHNLALRSDGTVRAWGDNASGQLGNGTTVNSNIPVQVNNLTGVIAISAGGSHSLAIKSDGTIWAWGNNAYGQLGNGTTDNSSVPLQVNGLDGIFAISAGSSHSLALSSDGKVWSWGYNGYGQLGTQTFTDSHLPSQVGNLNNIVAVSAGEYHSVALKSDGNVYSWGYNKNGQLGNGTYEYGSVIPVAASNLSNIISVSAGGNHSLGLKSDGSIWAWGRNNGVLGIGNLNGTLFGGIGETYYPILGSIPIEVAGPGDVVAVSAGYNHSLALSRAGLPSTTALTSSANPSTPGQPVTFTATVSATPPATGTPTGTVTFKDGTITLASVALNAGGQASYTTSALSTGSHTITSYYGGDSNFAANFHIIPQNAGAPITGDAWTWGSSVGNVPARINNLNNVIALRAGGSVKLALNSDGTVWNWDDVNPPVQVNGLNNVISIDAAYTHRLALKSDGTVWAWGRNESGQLGNGTNTSSDVPVQVSNLTDIVAISAGGGSLGFDNVARYAHSLAVKSDGSVWAWGDNSSGQLGNGTTVNSNLPVQVTGLSDVLAVSTSWRFSLALKNDGAVWAWGLNGSGQLGNGTTVEKLTATAVVGLKNVVAIESGGGPFSLALISDGTVRAWGNNLPGGNTPGSLGNGGVLVSGIYASSVPIRVSNLAGVTNISAGPDYSLALSSGDIVWSWGANGSGQLGNGTTQNSEVPAQINGLNQVLLINAGYSRGLALSSKPLTPSTTALESSVNPSMLGQPVIFTATVSAVPPASGIPTGMVTFKDGTTTLTSVALNASGQASYTTSNLSPGEHSISATYITDNVYGSSSSPVIIQTITPLPGDANGDLAVNALDITKVERVIAGLDSTTAGSDANADGSVNAIDITKVERTIAGLE